MKRKVKVQYLFSSNDLIGSKVIVWGTKHMYPELKIEEIPSHVAILIDEKWVLESTLETGVRVMGYRKWQTLNNEVAKIDCIMEARYWEDIKEMFKKLKGMDYDWAGVIYLGLWLGANKATGLTIPSDNAWHSDSKYFCCEIMAKMTELDYQMAPPVRVMMDLRQAIHDFNSLMK